MVKAKSTSMVKPNRTPTLEILSHKGNNVGKNLEVVMSVSMFDLFRIGVGPSSSHTVGPMLAANQFVASLTEQRLLAKTTRVQIDLYGSLALTGIGHGTDKAILNGLEGFAPETVDPDSLTPRMANIIEQQSLNLAGTTAINYQHQRDLLFHKETFLPEHSNGMRITAFAEDKSLFEQTYFSIGGGFVLTADEYGAEENISQRDLPYPFESAKQLLQQCSDNNLTIAELMFANEQQFNDADWIKQRVNAIKTIMEQCIEIGCATRGELPGGLNVTRRAADLYQKLSEQTHIKSELEAADVLNYLNAYAIAVNEQNAAGARVVTAPTNGAAGVIPAVWQYYMKHHKPIRDDAAQVYFLTAGAIAILYKKNASISAAEVGCQGEIGVASSMAAAGLTALLGGSLTQIENAAEIAMEHHLGMTCDPIAGLVQIPCIERNAMGAVKAVNATRLALLGTGEHKVSLDKVIDTMWRTGRDMMTIYKETSLGGLAVNIPEC